MRSKAIIIIALLALVSLMIMPVSAETLSGEISGGEGWLSYNMNATGAGGTSAFCGGAPWVIVNSEYTEGTKSYIHFDTPTYIMGYSGGAPAEAHGWFNFTHGTNVVATGTIGYQRYYSGFPPVEQPGYQYLTFDTWNTSSLVPSTNEVVYCNFNGTAVPITTTKEATSLSGAPSGYIHVGGGTTSFAYGINTYNKEDDFINSYSVTKPSGLGITGTIFKHALSDTVIKNSRVYIINATGNQVIASESTVSGTDFYFNTLAQSVYIALNSSANVWYNSSVLFTVAGPTPTPTPTTTIPAGYVRTYVQNVDGITSGAIHGSDIQIKDVESGTWSNWTDDSDGTGYIDTLPYHTLNIYGEATGYTSTSRLGLNSFSEGIYELIMFPTNAFLDPGDSNVNLIVLVNDKGTALPITSASILVTIPSGASIGGSTGLSGVETFVVPNASIIHVTASKIGYVTGTRTLTTSDFGPDTIRIELPKAVITVTPTSTIPPGGVTPAVTVDPRSTSQKDTDMMNQVRDAGPLLISLAILATMFGLIKLMGKK